MPQPVILSPDASVGINSAKDLTRMRAHIRVRSLVALWLLGMTMAGTFFIPHATHAVHGGIHIVPTPGETCANFQGAEYEECVKSICPQGRTCVQGKCLIDPRGNPELETLPCNFTLDDIVLAAIRVAQFIFGITGSLLLVFLFYGGYQYLISVGNPEHVQAAKKTLTAAFVGLIIVLGATIFIRFAAALLIPGPSEEPGATIPVPREGEGLPKIELPQ